MERLEDRRLLAIDFQLLTDLNATPSGAAATASSNPHDLAIVGDSLFFVANDGVHGESLWKTDGTESGTVWVKSVSTASGLSYERLPTNVHGTLYFRDGGKLWRSDGTTGGTVRVVDATGADFFLPNDLTSFGGLLYFSAINPLVTPLTPRLWRSDGTPEGTALVKDVNIYTNDDDPAFATVGETFYFGSYPSQLWKSDGTTTGTVLAHEVGTNVLHEMRNVDGVLLFSGFGYRFRAELWSSDGTAEGTALLKYFDANDSENEHLYSTVAGGTLYFRANDGAHGYELWKSDGTTEGTVLVKDIRPGTGNGVPRPGFGQILAVGETVFFPAYEGDIDRHLWKTDGTEAGTVKVKDISWGSPVNVAGSLYFIGQGELWSSDGTTEGTALLHDFDPQISSTPRAFRWEDRVVVAATTVAQGRELWIGNLTPSVEGDFNIDQTVDGADVLFWQRQLGSSVSPAGSRADADASGVVDGGDVGLWRTNFGAGSGGVAAPAAADESSAIAARAAAVDAVFAAGDVTAYFSAPTTTTSAPREFRPMRRLRGEG